MPTAGPGVDPRSCPTIPYVRRIDTLTRLQRDVPTGVLAGDYDERFTPVVDAFVANFSERGEVGASLCVVHEGDTVVDVWGGASDPAAGRPWERDTVSIVFSCTKGATALCAHLLADTGRLDLDGPVADVWPEFAVKGKERVTVRMMLDHSAGVPVFRGSVEDGELYDWDRVVARLEAEEPFWEPGTRNGYHMVNFGWTVGELVRRVSGSSLGTYFRDAVADPLELDFWIGLPEEVEPRVAPMLPYVRAAGDPLGDFALAVLSDPASISALSMSNLACLRVNTREAHAAEIGGAGGIGNARSLAGMYRPLSLGGDGLVTASSVERMRRISVATNRDATLLMPTRFAAGFMVSMDNRRVRNADSVLLGEHAFGHVGAGGSIGFADPAIGIAVGYTMNRMGPGLLLNERGQSLVDAVYAVTA
jgi:CubicO group peptidase (beta-lactamase class C family)